MLDQSTMIPAEKVRTVLPFAGPWLEKTLSEFSWYRWTMESIVLELERGALQLWGAQIGTNYLFVITEVIMEVTGKSVHIVLGGGKLDEDKAILYHINLIENWARDIGATSVVVWGRVGWKKLLAPHDYRFETAMFRRTLNERMN